VIVRTWIGWTRPEDARAYLGYLRATGVAAYRGTEGNLGVRVLMRELSDRVEFVVVSHWVSMEAIRRFAGNAPERAVFYPDDERYLIDREELVRHYTVLLDTDWEYDSGEGRPGDA
jgi:heme-degrading monooxygenase HmoA